MTRKVLRDEEKIARGTYEERYGEAARQKKRLGVIHAFPIFREIPEPTIPMREVARKTYDTWSRRLFDNGHLTVISQGFVENLAMADQIAADAYAAGKAPPASVLTQRNRALAELKYLDADQSLTPHKPEESRFRRNGFPRRLR